MKFLCILVSACCLIPSIAFSQVSVTGNEVSIFSKPEHCGPQAAMLAAELVGKVATRHLRIKYPLIDQGETSYIPALVKLTPSFDHHAFSRCGISVNAQVRQIYSIRIPTERYIEFLETPGIEHIELGVPVYSRLDMARAESGVDFVHSGTGLSQAYSGAGVVVGIIDFGFDYTHPVFFDAATGNYRISRIWEQNNSLGLPPAGFSYGSEFTGEQDILNERTDLVQSGHGTHVASIAVGGGAELEGKYRGVAYESEIVLVSMNVQDGVSGNNTGVIDGLDYIFQYAELVGKPAVVNLSLGHHTGPHDGTSLADQAIDAMSGPGRIVVGAVGNEGDPSGFYLHLDHVFEDENAILTYLVWPDEVSAGSTIVDIWGEPGSEFEVGIELYNPQNKEREAIGEVFNSGEPVTFLSGVMVDNEGDTLHYEGGIGINPMNGRPHARLYIDNTGQADGGDVNLENLLDNDFVQLRLAGNTGTVHAWAANNSGEAFFTDLSGIGADEFIEEVRVTGGNPNSTMGELGGTAQSIISVGGYTTRNRFSNTMGETYMFEDSIGGLFFRSSRGPTIDGRVKPDISAPANLIAAAENSFNTGVDPALVIDQVDKPAGDVWTYGIRRGTSASAPLVAGVVALMLEAQPDLTPIEARSILADHARMDGFTGSVPNNTWGSGKIDAVGAVAVLERTTATEGFGNFGQIEVFPNPASEEVMLKWDIDGDVHARIVGPDGRTVLQEQFRNAGHTVSIELPKDLSGLYFLHLTKGNTTCIRKFVISR